jgi:PAS domain S-box-containing protein
MERGGSQSVAVFVSTGLLGGGLQKRDGRKQALAPDAVLARLARSRSGPWWWNVLIGLAFAAGGLFIRWAGQAFYGEVTGFMILLPAVVLAALAGGRTAGVVATFGCLFGGWVVAGPLAVGAGVSNAMGRVATVNFIIVGLFCTVVAASLRQTVRRLDETIVALGGSDEALRRSESRFRTAVDAMRGILWTNTADGRMDGDQPGWSALTGQTRDQYHGYGWSAAVHPDDAGPTVAAWNEAVARHRTFDVQHRVRTVGGDYRTFAVRAVPTLDTDGQLLEWVGVHTDVTEARAAEAALRESEERFRLMADTAPSPVWLTDAAGNVEFVNKALEAFYGRPGENFHGQVWKTSVHPDDLAAVNSIQAEARESRSPYGFECRFRRHDGVWRWLRVSVNPRLDGDGAFQGYVGLSFDVTETRVALEALAAQERRQRFLLELDDGVREIEDPAAIMDHVQSVLGRLLGVSRVGYGEFSADRTTVELMPDWTEGVPSLAGRIRMPDLGEQIMSELFLGLTATVEDVTTDPRTTTSMRSLAASQIAAYVAVPLFRAGEMRAFLYVHSAGPRTWTPEDVALIADAADRTWSVVERARAEAELRESEARFRDIADTAPVLIWVTRQDGTRAFVNQAYVDYIGGSYETALQADWRALIHPDDHQRIIAESVAGEASGEPFSLEARYLRHDGEHRWLKSFSRPRLGARGQLLGFVGVAFDVTDAQRAEQDLKRINELLEERVGEALAEKARAEADLMHAQRMEAVGRLTGGVAHDFNNLLTVVIGGLDMILRSPEDGARRQKMGEAALAAARRGERLTHQLLAFSRRQTLRPEPADLNALIRQSAPLLRRAVGEALDYRLKLRRGGAHVIVDPAQFEAALLNLIVNARDAIGEKGPGEGGTITVKTRSCRIEAGEVTDVEAGDYVCVSVSDTGPGMDEETLRRVFEPFFTTKAVGKGTGLGLSQVYGFARQSGGGVRIESTRGEGATVDIYLPPAARTDTAPVEPAATPAATTSGRLLLVEDDPGVTMVAIDLLTMHGLDVTTAENGPEALSRLETGTFDIMLTDVVMPGGMSGVELARRAAALYPAMRILLASGYAGDEVDDELRGAPWPLLRKPYSGDELFEALTRACATRSGAGD